MGNRDVDINFNVFLGAENGTLKGVYFGEETPRLRNFHDFSKPTKSRCPEITHLGWADEDDSEQQLLVVHKNHVIKIYNRKLHAFTQSVQLGLDASPIVGIHCYESNYLLGTENGEVNLWSFLEDKSVLTVKVGEHMAKLKYCPNQKSLFATGGKENDLKIFNLNAPEPSVPIFKAKNVAHNFLDLRIPVWIQDLTFMPQSVDLIGVCTRYGDLRLYDTKSNNKGRPIIDTKFVDHPLMVISTTRNARQVIVGSAQGKMGLIDIRNAGKNNVVHQFVGHSGGIRSISAHANGPHFVSCGLDRHLHLHQLDSSKGLKKMYVNSILNCALMTEDFTLEKEEKKPEILEVSSVWQNINKDVISKDAYPCIKKPKL